MPTPIFEKSRMHRFRLAVVSPKFRKMFHLKRQDRVWEIVDATLDREQAVRISLILAYAPDELATANRARKKKGSPLRQMVGR